MIVPSSHPSFHFQRVLYAFMTLSIPVLLLSASIRLVMTPLFLAFEYNREGFPIDFYGFSKENRLEYAPLALNYLINREPITYLESLRLPIQLCWGTIETTDSDCPMYNARELRHMADVQQITTGFFTLTLWIIVIWLALFWWLWRAPQRRLLLLHGIRSGALLTLALIATIVIIALGAWDTFFTAFHQLFFAEGTWQFAYSDTLIRLFPEQFWFDAAIGVGLLTVIGACILLAAVYTSKKLIFDRGNR